MRLIIMRFEEKLDIKDKDVNLLITPFDKEETLEKMGYSIDKEGFLIDIRTKKRVTAEDNKEINVKEDKNFALISGSSHVFVRNVAGFSQYLAERGLLKFREKVD
jgi:hypothetical protein